MNAVDLILGGVLVFAVQDGVRRGFIASSFSLLVWSFAFLIAVALTRFLVGVYAEVGWDFGGAIRLALFCLVLFLAAGWLLVGGRYIEARLRASLFSRPTLAFTERWLGIFPSILRTSIAAAALLTAVNVFPVWPPMREAVSGSIFARALVSSVEAVEPQLASLLGTGERPLFLAVIQGSEEQALSFPERTEAQVDLEQEQALYELLNKERAREGLAPLTSDVRLTVVAREHAEEMFALRYLSHLSPNTGKPSDRLERRRIAYGIMGENVAYAPTPALAHQGFLRSRSHRANLLDPRFIAVGIGAVSVGVHGTLYVQLFVAP